jgi:hypothetical protein
MELEGKHGDSGRGSGRSYMFEHNVTESLSASVRSQPSNPIDGIWSIQQNIRLQHL